MTDEFPLIMLPDESTLDGDFGWYFTGATEMWQREQKEVYGNADLVLTPAELVALSSTTEGLFRHTTTVVAPDDPTMVVASSSVDLPRIENTHTAEIHLTVRREFRGRGIGTRLLEWATSIARDAGRSTAIGPIRFGIPTQPGPRAAAPDGTWMPADNPGWRFAHNRGWTLELVERVSRLDLPVDPDTLARLHADADAQASGYRIETWYDDIPQRWRPGYANLMRTVSADAPQGGLDVTEEIWDENRVATQLDESRRMDRLLLTTAGIHETSGELAAMTVLSYPKSPGPFAFQWETAVAANHRGHRLGMLVKTTNLKALITRRPATQRIYTFNAEQNAHMLAINIALGFHPSGGVGVTQKTL